MAAPSIPCSQQAWRSGSTSKAFAARKQQALVVLLVQQLIEAQFVRADRAASDRLWQEVAALEIDPERMVHLLYSGLESSDRPALLATDDQWIQRNAAATLQRPWSLRQLHRSQRPRRPQGQLSPA